MAQVKKTILPSKTDEEIITSVSEDNGTKSKEVQEIIETQESELQENIEQDKEIAEQVEEFREGGVLKAQPGTSADFWTEFERKKKRAEELRNSGFIMAIKDPVVEEEIVNEPLDDALYEGRKKAIDVIYANDPEGKARALGGLNYERGAGTENTVTENTVTEPSETNTKLGWPFYLREATNLANWAAARRTAKDLKTIGHKTADVMGRMTLNALAEQSFKYNLPIHNQYDRNIAKYESQANQFVTSDAGLNTASRLAILDKSAEMRNEQARLTSEAVSQQNQLHDQKKEPYNQVRTEVANKNKQIMAQAALARLNADSAYEQERRRLDDALLYKYQDLLNRLGGVDASIKNKAYQYAEQELAARAAGNENLAQQYAKLKEDTQKPEYRSYMLNNVIYGRKGTKLRSTTDMMLLNNQKNVAKAIEKLNDNTMKLILKALS